MKAKLLSLLWLGLLLLSRPAIAQDDVRRALSLHRLYEQAKRLDGDKFTVPDSLSRVCRQFFLVLTDDALADTDDAATASVITAYEAYADNAFVGRYADQMFQLWIKAGRPINPQTHQRDTMLMQKSRQVHRYNATLQSTRYQLRTLLVQKLAQPSQLKKQWKNLGKSFGNNALVAASSYVDSLTQLLNCYDSLFAHSKGVSSRFKQLLDTLQVQLPEPPGGLALHGWPNLVALNTGLANLEANYSAAKADIAAEVERELISAGPKHRAAVVGLFSFANTTAGPSLTETLGHPALPASGPPASWETAVLDGTARFVAKRFREELSATFVQQFARLMGSRDSATFGRSLQLLFPATRELLTSGSASYSGVLVQPLRAAMQRDLQTVVLRYGELLVRNDINQTDATRENGLLVAEDTLRKRLARQLTLQTQKKGAQAPALAALETKIAALTPQLVTAQANVNQLADKLRPLLQLRYAFLTVQALRYLAEGRHPAEMLTHLADELANTTTRRLLGEFYVDQTLLPVLQTLQSLSAAFTDTRSLRQAWTDESQLAALFRQPQPLVLFQGLVWQRLTTSPTTPASLRLVLWQAGQGRGALRFQQLVFGFGGLAVRFEQHMQRLNAPAKSDSSARYARARVMLDLYQTTLGLVRFGAEQVNAAGKPALARLEALQGVGELVVQSYAAAQQRQYGLALTSLVQVVEKTVPAGIVQDKLNWSQVVRYGSVMAAVGQARTPDEVQQALQAGALPSGSARVKRESIFTASLNAYAGLTGGGEHIQDSNRPWLRPNIGFMAAVGPAFTWGLHRKPGTGKYQTEQYVQARPWYARGKPERREMRGDALGLFISVIDLGAPVLLHLGESDGISTVPENVDFRHVFAPGAMLTYSLRNTPLTVLAGAQFTGNLRRTADDVARNSIRYNLSLAFDIPLVHFGVRTEARTR